MKRHSLYSRCARAVFPSSKAWVACVLIFGMSPGLHALDGPASFTITLPFHANEATPVWLGHPVTPPSTFATLDLPISPPSSTAALLVTVFFQEKEGGFLRVTWHGPQGAQTLSNNFYEGIGMSNQRSLLIPAQILRGDGTLNFQCGDTALGIQRIKLEWLENQTTLISPQVQDLLVTPSNGVTQPAQILDGQAKPADDAAWKGHFVTVPITTLPLRIEQGVEFSVQVNGVPAAARLVLKETGLPLGKHLVVWINRRRAGSVTPTVPDLTDDGFSPDATGSPAYVGWREASFFVPAALWKGDVNTLQFSEENDVPFADPTAVDPATQAAPLAVKDVILQFNYPPPETTTPVIDVASATAETASDAAAPASSATTDPAPASLPPTPPDASASPSAAPASSDPTTPAPAPASPPVAPATTTSP